MSPTVYPLPYTGLCVSACSLLYCLHVGRYRPSTDARLWAYQVWPDRTFHPTAYQVLIRGNRALEIKSKSCFAVVQSVLSECLIAFNLAKRPPRKPCTRNQRESAGVVVQRVLSDVLSAWSNAFDFAAGQEDAAASARGTRSPISLCASYALSGSEICMVLSLSLYAYALSGTDIAHGAPSLRACYALSGTEIAYACYAPSGTEIAYEIAYGAIPVALSLVTSYALPTGFLRAVRY
eukprot:2701808-Rhodomonas_salina.4